MNSKKLERIVTHIEDLPTLPTTVLKITELINNPKSSARDIANIITDDQVLTARLLKLVNSSFYGFPQKISTVTGAIVLLGFDAIRDLLLTTSIFDVFLTKNKAIKNDLERLWKHSLGCAIAAKIIGSYTKYDKLEELFVAGLLHDIGKVVEALFFPDDFSRIYSLVNQKKIRIFQAEEEVFGFTHADTGKLLAKQWNLPSKIASVIAQHHAKELTGRFIQEISIVHISDIICRALDLGSGGDNMIPSLNDHAWNILQMDADLIHEIMEKVDMEFRDLNFFA